MKKSRTRDVVYGGLTTAIVICCLFAGIYIKSSRFFFMAAATYISSIPYMIGGTKTGILSFAATSITAILVLPDRLYSIVYIIVGIYPCVKGLSERKYGKMCEYIIKYIWVNAAMILIFLLTKSFMPINYYNNKINMIISVIAAVQIAFYFYDYIFTLFVSFFIKKFKNILGGY